MNQHLLRKLLFLLRRHVTAKHSPVRIVLFAVVIFAISYALHQPTAPAAATPKGAMLSCTVKSVYDGDTIRVLCPDGEIKVRLFGIDAPEMGQTPWGTQSRNLLREWAPPGRAIRLEIKDRDRYGRTVAKVFIEDFDAGLGMVQHGRAVVYTRYNDDPAYDRMQQEAQQARRGIWAEPGGQQNPGAWRKLNPR